MQKDLTLALDATEKRDGEWQYIAVLFEGWPEERRLLTHPVILGSRFPRVAVPLKGTSDEICGAALFDWAFPPESKMRQAFLCCCEDIEQCGGVLRLWLCIGPTMTDQPEFQWLELAVSATWEGFWVREWADQSKKASRERNPFLALNPWINIIRCPPEVSVQRRFTVPGRIRVLVIASNPPPDSPPEFPQIKLLPEMFDRVWEVFQNNEDVDWVHKLWNADKVGIAAAIREHKPHVVFYLGHGYAKAGSRGSGSGLVLAVSEEGNARQYVSGLRGDARGETELEKMLAGKAVGLKDPTANDQGLPAEERPRLVILLCCEAAPAAPALLESHVPAVVAMRRRIFDRPTVGMIQHLLFPLIEKGKPLDASLIDLRHSLVGTEPHWSVPVLHLGVKEAVLFPDEEQYARGQYIQHMRKRCGRFGRTFGGSQMNDLTESTYVRQKLGELVKEKVQTKQGREEEREVEHQREFREALDHRKVVTIGRAGRGKTSLLYWAVQTSLSELENDKSAVVPVYVPLKEMQKAKSLEVYIQAELHDERIVNWLSGHIQKGNVLLLLDGLDEVPRDERRQMISDCGIFTSLVRKLTASQARVVLTCRDSVYTELAGRLSEIKVRDEEEGFVKMELKRFNREQILTYAQRYFREDQKVKAFLMDIQDPRGQSGEGLGPSRLTYLAEEPLYLHMLCWLWEGKRSEVHT